MFLVFAGKENRAPVEREVAIDEGEVPSGSMVDEAARPLVDPYAYRRPLRPPEPEEPQCDELDTFDP